MSHLLDWESVCLACLQKGETRSIFNQDIDSKVIADKIMKCADIFIKRDTNQPKNICFKCLDDLNVAYRFRRNCEQSDSIIKALLNKNHQFQIKDLWKMTPTIVNPTHGICIKEEIVEDNAPGLTVEADSDAETKFVFEVLADASLHGSAMELHNVKADECNKIKQEANNEISRPNFLTEVSCARPVLRSVGKKPSKICEICNRSCRNQREFDIHMRRHNDERPFSCDYCTKSFVTSVELRRHVIVHTGDKPFKCQYCDRRFTESHNRKNHERIHTDERPYVCATCGKSFGYSYGLTRHLRIHTGMKKSMGNDTGKVSFEKHLVDDLGGDELIKLSENEHEKRRKKEVFQIEECPNTNEINIKHEIVDSPVVEGTEIEVNLVVEDRAEPGVQSTVLETNNVKAKRANNDTSIRLRSQSKPVKDVHCARPILKSTSKRTLKICKICDRGFRDRHGLETHMRRHNDERPFSCDHCDKSFVTVSDLRRHVRLHSGQKPYKCQHCHRGFADSYARKYHERIHTGERPYVCPTCGKTFRLSNVLRKHLRIHTGVKRVVAKTRSSARKDHERTHTGKRTYLCTTCSKSFTDSHALVRHIRTHTGEKAFVCNDCGKGFTKKVYFEKHVAHHLTQGELGKSRKYQQKITLEKEFFKVEECTNSNEIHIKHEVSFTEEEIN